MGNAAKIKLNFLEKELDFSVSGLDAKFQLELMKSAADQFFADLAMDLGSEEEEEKETAAPEEDEEAAAALGVDPAAFGSMAEAFAFAGVDREKGKTTLSLMRSLGPSHRSSHEYGDIFQTFYICEDRVCRNKGKHFVPKGTPYVNCHSCGKQLKVRPAILGAFPHKDEFGNIFIAGDFMRSDERLPSMVAE